MTPEPQTENRGAGGRDGDIHVILEQLRDCEGALPLKFGMALSRLAKEARDSAEQQTAWGHDWERQYHEQEADLAALRAERDALMRAGVRYLNAPYSGEASADPEYGAARNEMRLALGFDAGNPERNHYDWYWPSYIPRPLTAEWLTEIREAMVAARTDPFCDDAAQIMLVLIDSLLALDSEKWTLVDERNDLYRRMQEQAHRAEIAEGENRRQRSHD